MTDPGSGLVGRTGCSTDWPLATEEVRWPSETDEVVIESAAEEEEEGVANAHCAKDEKMVARERT